MHRVSTVSAVNLHFLLIRFLLDDLQALFTGPVWWCCSFYQWQLAYITPSSTPNEMLAMCSVSAATLETHAVDMQVHGFSQIIHTM